VIVLSFKETFCSRCTIELHLEVCSRLFHSTRSLEQSTRALDPDPSHNLRARLHHRAGLGTSTPLGNHTNRNSLWKSKNRY
jgi:hypothetical protein